MEEPLSSVFSFQIAKDILIVLVTFCLQLDGHYSLKNQAGDLYYCHRLACVCSRYGRKDLNVITF